MFARLKQKYLRCFENKAFLISFFTALLMLAAALIINVYAVAYANASSAVTDIILSNIHVYDVDGLFVNGAFGLVAFITIVCLLEPKRIPFTVKTISIFVITRSIFIMMTHLGPFPNHIVIDPNTSYYLQDILGKNLYASFFTGNDFFFSGHTGLPFLMSLLYWDKKWLRYTFMAASIGFGIIVLLAHLHYTIDVLSAFFIAYGVYRLARIFFARDLDAEQIGQRV